MSTIAQTGRNGSILTLSDLQWVFVNIGPGAIADEGLRLNLPCINGKRRRIEVVGDQVVVAVTVSVAYSRYHCLLGGCNLRTIHE